MRICLNLFVWLSFVIGSLLGADSRDPGQHEKNECRHNLRLIQDAIRHYRRNHQDFPQRLSDLFPGYLADPDLLWCPAARLKGMTSTATQSSDPKTSYCYELSLSPLKEIPGKTTRDWKRAQMDLLGSAVPIVRCLKAHDHALNLPFDGEVYDSAYDWEYNFTNLVQYADLGPRILLDPKRVRTISIPPRDPAAKPEQLDLSAFYNAALAKPWLEWEPEHHLSSFPAGLREFAGVRFDARGLIQLASRSLEEKGGSFPKQVTNIIAECRCRRLQFLVGAAQDAPDDSEAARVRIYLADGSRQEFAFFIGRHLHPTWSSPSDSAELTAGKIGWTGQPTLTPSLYVTAWENPHPATTLQRLELLSSTSKADLFVLAITVEP